MLAVLWGMDWRELELQGEGGPSCPLGDDGGFNCYSGGIDGDK